MGNSTLISNNIREGLELAIRELSQHIAGITDTADWILVLPLPLMLSFLCALFFLSAVTILVVRDFLRLLSIFILGSHVASLNAYMRIMNEGGSKKILIAGDSTAVGSGAKEPGDTLMGMFAHDFPHIEIHNIGENGALTKDVITQLEKVEHEHFSLALISTGGNDVWRLTSLHKLTQDLNTVLRRAITLTNGKVVLLIYSNIGSAPVFPIFFRDYLIYRSAKINHLFRSIAKHYNIQCVDVFTDTVENPFMKDPKEFFARDGIHPSTKGYRLWYNRLWRLLINRNYDLRR